MICSRVIRVTYSIVTRLTFLPEVRPTCSPVTHQISSTVLLPTCLPVPEPTCSPLSRPNIHHWRICWPFTRNTTLIQTLTKANDSNKKLKLINSAKTYRFPKIMKDITNCIVFKWIKNQPWNLLSVFTKREISSMFLRFSFYLFNHEIINF